MSKKKEVALQVPFKLEDVVSLEYEGETWYHISSVIGYLRDVREPGKARKYWNKCKTDLKTRENIETSPIWRQLSLTAADGKTRDSDFATHQGILRIIQSVPSPAPKIQAVKDWLAKKGAEALTPLSSPAFVKECVEDRKELCAEIASRLDTIRPWDFKNITDTGYKSWSDKTAKMWRKDLDLSPKANVRPHLTRQQRLCAWTQEIMSKDFIIANDAHGYDEIMDCVKKGGAIALQLRKSIAASTGKDIISRPKQLMPTS